MSPSMLRPALIALTATALVGPLAAPSPASAARERTVKIVSVDGPLLLTVREGKKAPLAIRLAGLDAPEIGQCGAELTTAGLRKVAKPGSTRTIELLTGPGSTDPAGRALAFEQPWSGKKSKAMIGTRLAKAGLARTDTPVPDPTASGQPPHAMSAGIGYSTDMADFARRGIGIWGACRGRFHGPAAETGPRPAGTPWIFDGDGITRAIGGLPLSADLRPSTTTRYGDLLRAYPDTEFVRDDRGACSAYSASAGILATGWANDDWYALDPVDQRPCMQQAIIEIQSFGQATGAVEGGATIPAGATLATMRAALPSMRVDEEIDNATQSFRLPLSGRYSPPWAWAAAGSFDGGKLFSWHTELPVDYTN